MIGVRKNLLLELGTMLFFAYPVRSQTLFGTEVSYAVGTRPFSVTAADFNGDGKLDLVTANYDANTVSVLLGNGAGSFAASSPFTVGYAPISVAAADFNGDGKLDLVTANNGANTVSVLLGNGAGSFAASSPFTVGTSPFSVAAADFNGDGKLDLVTANYGANTVSVLLGNGAGSFAASSPFTVGSQPISVAAADFNGDGKLDLVTANYNSAGTVSVLLGNGAGSFGASSPFPVGTSPRSVAAADFNGDGKLDLVTANQGNNTVSILLGNGAGSFAASSPFTVGYATISVAAADFNGDGMLDLVTANQGDNTVSVLLGNGAGSFAAASHFTVGARPHSVAAADFNGDGKLDLVTTNYVNNTVSVLLGTSAGTSYVTIANTIGAISISAIVFALYRSYGNRNAQLVARLSQVLDKLSSLNDPDPSAVLQAAKLLERSVAAELIKTRGIDSIDNLVNEINAKLSTIYLVARLSQVLDSLSSLLSANAPVAVLQAAKLLEQSIEAELIKTRGIDSIDNLVNGINSKLSTIYSEAGIDYMRSAKAKLDSDLEKAPLMKTSLSHFEDALLRAQRYGDNNHPDIVSYRDNMKLAQDELARMGVEFKGQGTLSYSINCYPEYYNSGIDQILELRLASLDIGSNSNVKLLKSRFFTKELSFGISQTVNDVAVAFSSDTAQVILAPFSLYNEHWVGLSFRNLGAFIEVTYMDSEQGALLPDLRTMLENGLLVNGYKSKFLEPRLERQRYHNCGSELIENFIYYLTGNRATQEGALYLHSLMVENKLLDPAEYGLQIQGNNKLLGFLSNTAPLSIGSIDLFQNAKTTTISHVRSPNAAREVNLLPAINQFNKLWTKWLQDKLHQANAIVYKTNLGFKGLDLAIDSARLIHQPNLANAKKVALDSSYLYGMVAGVNGYSLAISGAEAAYQTSLGEYQQAVNIVGTTVGSMALPYILVRMGNPYLSFAYGALMAMHTIGNAISNAYDFAKELMSEDATLKSAVAYNDLFEWCSASPIQAIYDFKAYAIEYKLQINDILFEREKSEAIAHVKDKGEFSQKIFDHIYLPAITEKYNLMNDVVRGLLTQEEAEASRSKHTTITYGTQHYDHCMEVKGVAEHYYCYNLEKQIFDRVAVTGDDGIELLDR